MTRPLLVVTAILILLGFAQADSSAPEDVAPRAAITVNKKQYRTAAPLFRETFDACNEGQFP